MKRISILIIVLLLSACTAETPSASQIETAIAQTQAANPTSTPTEKPTSTEVPTNTPEPTATSTPEPTATFTPEPTPSPTPDVRIIVGNPEDYILLPEDLPNKYILNRGDSTPHINSEILSARGIEDGKAYLEATGRLGGWIIWYECVESTAIAPDWIRSYIVMYDSIDGPDIAMLPEWNTVYEGYETIDLDLKLGEWNRVSVYKERQASGKYFLRYVIEFTYRNIWAEIYGSGIESDVRHEYLENAARAVLEKLEAAPLDFP
jgi:hypothetical protein